MKKYIFFLSFLFGFQVLLAQTGKISGTVYDAATKEPVIGANIIIVNTTLGAISDLDGNFLIEKIPVGTISIRISMIGYTPVVKTDLIVVNAKTTNTKISLEATSVSSDEVVVRADYYSKPKEITTSVQSLSFEEIRRAPGAAADISRMIQTLPGVVQTSDMRNDLIVRGGSPSENLNLVDGFEIPTINHFGAQGTSGGAIGMIQTDFISEANFMTGGFPSMYGEKLSSVLDVKLREGSNDKLFSSFDLSMAGAGIIAEGPIGSKTTFLFSARRSYLDFVIKSSGLTVVPKYSNINAKVIHRLSDQDIVNVLILDGWDEMLDKQDPDGKNSETVYENYQAYDQQHLFGTSWKHIFSEGGFSTLRIWESINTYKSEEIDLVRTPKGLVAKKNSLESQTAAQYDIYFSVGKMFEVNGGMNVRRTFLDYDMFMRADTNWYGTPYDALQLNRSSVNSKASSYVQTTLKPTDELNITSGIRVNYYNALDKKYSIDPRFGISYELFPYMTLNGSVGIYHQTPEAIWIFGDKTPNRDLLFLRTTQTVLGFEIFPDAGMKISVEGYIKRYTNYPVSKKNIQVSLANSGDMFVANTSSDLISEGTGKSIGIDFFVQKKLTDDLYGLISYSYNQTKHKALDGIERPGSFDIPHVFTISGGYKINTQWEISSKYRFVSGKPHNRIDVEASKARHTLIYDPMSINTDRYPDYWRWDVRVDYRTYFNSFNLVAYLDIENVTNRDNIWSYSWNKYDNKQTTFKQFGFLPVAGMKLEF